MARRERRGARGAYIKQRGREGLLIRDKMGMIQRKWPGEDLGVETLHRGNKYKEGRWQERLEDVDRRQG